jgi:hypothetical protein
MTLSAFRRIAVISKHFNRSHFKIIKIFRCDEKINILKTVSCPIESRHLISKTPLKKYRSDETVPEAMSPSKIYEIEH